MTKTPTTRSRSTGEPPASHPPDSHPRHPTYESEPRGPFGKALMVFLGVVVVALLAMWFYVFSGLAKRDHPDTLASQEFPMAAEAICADADRRFDAIPVLVSTEDIAERANLIDEGVEVLEAMVRDLRMVAPPVDTSDGAIIDQWFGDWQVHLEDRSGYADKLREPEASIFTPFVEQVVEERQLSDRIDRFAEVNEMLSCVHPDDL